MSAALAEEREKHSAIFAEMKVMLHAVLFVLSNIHTMVSSAKYVVG